MCSHGARVVGLREGNELRVRERYRSTGARGGAQSFHSKVKEAALVRNDRPAHGEVHVVGVEWFVGTRGRAHEVLIGEHLLVVEPIRHRTVELVGARACGKDRQQTRGAAIFAAKGVYLNAGLLDGIGLGCQIQHTLANSARDVEAIDNILVIVLTLAVGAGVDLLFG